MSRPGLELGVFTKIIFKLTIDISMRKIILEVEYVIKRMIYQLLKFFKRIAHFIPRQERNEGLWRQPLPDVRKFRTSGHACAEVTNITAHAQNRFLSLTAPLGTKFYFLSSLQSMASLAVLKTQTSLN